MEKEDYRIVDQITTSINCKPNPHSRPSMLGGLNHYFRPKIYNYVSLGLERTAKVATQPHISVDFDFKFIPVIKAAKPLHT